MALFGKTGAGKTTLLETMIMQDVLYGRGQFIVDVHGDLSRNILSKADEKSKSNIVILDMADPNQPWYFNPLAHVDVERRSLMVSNIIDTFKKLWKAAWGAKMEHILRNILLTLIDQPTSNFADVYRILHQKEFRFECLEHVHSKELLDFWKNEFPKYKGMDLMPIYNKIGAFLAHPSIRKLLILNHKIFDLQKFIEENKTIILRIPKGEIGNDSALLLASLFLNAVLSAGFSRSKIPLHARKPFILYLDEYPNYVHGNSIEAMLSELRKFNMGIVLSAQSLSMLSVDLRDIILGNVGSLIVFRVGYKDAQYFAKEFHPVFKASDFINLSNYEIYIRLFIDGKSSRGFSACTVLYSDISQRIQSDYPF
jgi:type IV secretory pathway TraG/TraD family ATPase VirD4